ncbi:alanine acetyltransferase [Pseudooceanicola nanhaiensis]|jgi:ribosomal-protein-alanine N-acetyltransferase|uniref:Alanine acetyltransferase n=1 Tax=Pseudooceanicola nanhaiensis TaxID=375761 RepID=A0A917SUH3_9RHOB|nr:GNAT family N-acetyltransferase [Pseudooceanicola nanhaiensis]GGL99220.1 alanine acetyltransferase [Pseudooceanicola nanhaiensis]
MTSEEMAALHDRSFTTPRAWSAVEFDALLASPGAFLETATEGFLLGRVIAGEAELLTLAVAPSARRAGQGRRLLAAFESNARARGAGSAFLEVAADNGPAIALYAGAGWETRGTRRAYYQRPDGSRVDAVVMSKPLA